jgi:dipeptidyl aminopeptidase/acylaminoacyl peptidase
VNTTTVFRSAFSPDESQILFTSDASGVLNAYVISVEGGEASQLTFSDSGGVRTLSFFPEDGRLLFEMDNEGDEVFHLFVREEGGSIRDLTPFEGARAEFHEWTHDESGFIFGCNKRDARFMDIYEMDLETLAPRMIYQSDQGLEFQAISNDERYLAFEKSLTTVDSDIYLLDTETGHLSHLTPHQGNVVFTPMAFSGDSKGLYFITDEDDEFRYLKRLDIESGGSEVVENPGWDIAFTKISRNGKYLIMGFNNDASTEMKVIDTGSGEDLDLSGLPDANISGVTVSNSETMMTFYMDESQSPDNLYLYEFESGELRRLTDSNNPEMNPDDLVATQRVRYESFDGLEIPAILYKPHNVKPGEEVPGIVWVHGGPGGQARVWYHPTIQYLVNHGYAVIDVNNRGSSGYGKTFYKLDDQKHGADDLLDCVYAKRYLASTGYVDTSRVAILGGSYGELPSRSV